MSDLNFWLNSDSDASMTSDSDDISVSNNKKSSKKTSKESKNPNPVLQNSMITRSHQYRQQPLQLSSVDDDPSQIVSQPQNESKNSIDPETASILQALSQLNKEVKQISIPILSDSDDDSIIITTKNDIPIDPTAKTIYLEEPITKYQIKVQIHPEDNFASIMKTLPEPYSSYKLLIDGITWNPETCPIDMVDDFSKIILVEPKDELAGCIKIVFSLPNKEKKKLAVDPETTFGEIAAKLNLKRCKFVFDGEIFSNDIKIGKADLENEDQVDIII